MHSYANHLIRLRSMFMSIMIFSSAIEVSVRNDIQIQAQVSAIIAIIWIIPLTWLRTKNGGCLSHDVKKYTKYTTTKNQ